MPSQSSIPNRPKPKKKLEPMTLDEIMDVPAHEGMLSFLKRDTAMEEPAMAVPVVAVPAVTARPPKLHRCASVEDGHSMGEHSLYLLLWNELGAQADASRKLVQISLSRLARRARMSQRNLQTVLQRLEEKLAIETASANNFVTGAPKTYTVYSPGAVLERRRHAGLEWVIRNKGVQFVSEEQARALERQRKAWEEQADLGLPAIAEPAMESSA